MSLETFLITGFLSARPWAALFAGFHRPIKHRAQVSDDILDGFVLQLLAFERRNKIFNHLRRDVRDQGSLAEIRNDVRLERVGEPVDSPLAATALRGRDEIGAARRYQRRGLKCRAFLCLNLPFPFRLFRLRLGIPCVFFEALTA